jgi:hypothetical protein
MLHREFDSLHSLHRTAHRGKRVIHIFHFHALMLDIPDILDLELSESAEVLEHWSTRARLETIGRISG